MKDFESEYRRSGDYHFRSRGFRKWWQSRNYAMLAGHVRPGMKVLDLACGDGRLLAEPSLQGSGVFPIGIDRSGAALAACALRFPTLPLVQGDLVAPPLKSACFDLVFISLSLQYVVRERLGEALKSAGRLLKPQGRLIISYPNAGKYAHYKAVKDDDALALPALREAVRAAGFEVRLQESVCRLLPPSIYRLSQKPLTAWLAWLYFRAVNLVPPPPGDSYHFVWVLEHNGSPS